MQRNLDRPPLRSSHSRLAFGGLALALGACHDGRHHDEGDVGFVDVYRELEPNDSELSANYFGGLRAGDTFYIDGYCSETDLDGFAFTSEEPIHVDFRLFVSSPYPDLDVCLFDPQLGELVACFETEFDPEEGGVDVTAGGLEFHLLIESFVGAGPYSLEIVVSPLYLREAQVTGAPGAIRATAPTATLERPASERATNPDAFQSYLERGATLAPVERTVTITIDPETGERMEVVRETAAPLEQGVTNAQAE